MPPSRLLPSPAYLTARGPEGRPSAQSHRAGTREEGQEPWLGRPVPSPPGSLAAGSLIRSRQDVKRAARAQGLAPGSLASPRSSLNRADRRPEHSRAGASGSGHPKVQAGTCRARRGHPHFQASALSALRGGTLPHPLKADSIPVYRRRVGIRGSPVSRGRDRGSTSRCRGPWASTPGSARRVSASERTLPGSLAGCPGPGCDKHWVSLPAGAPTRMGRRRWRPGRGRRTTAYTACTCPACTAAGAATAARPASRLRRTPSATRRSPSTCEPRWSGGGGRQTPARPPQ